jgi:2,4-dichlorophenol 6-monooxygenase
MAANRWWPNTPACPFEGKMGVGGSMNILFKADLSKYVAHRPSVLYWVMQPGADVGGIGMGLVRMVRPWNEWLIVWGYDINGPEPEVDARIRHQGGAATGRRPRSGDRASVGQHLDGEQLLRHPHANGRVFCMGDAIHRHPPSNGLGSNTSIQDSFNLAWKLAMVLKGQAGENCSTAITPNARRSPSRSSPAPTSRSSEFGPIFESLGLLEGVDPVKMQQNMDARCDDTEAAERAARGDPRRPSPSRNTNSTPMASR